jgi:hypothetical protein
MAVNGTHQSRPVLVLRETTNGGNKDWKYQSSKPEQVEGHGGGSQGLIWTVIPEKKKSVYK